MVDSCVRPVIFSSLALKMENALADFGRQSDMTSLLIAAALLLPTETPRLQLVVFTVEKRAPLKAKPVSEHGDAQIVSIEGTWDEVRKKLKKELGKERFFTQRDSSIIPFEISKEVNGEVGDRLAGRYLTETQTPFLELELGRGRSAGNKPGTHNGLFFQIKLDMEPGVVYGIRPNASNPPTFVIACAK